MVITRQNITKKRSLYDIKGPGVSQIHTALTLLNITKKRSLYDIKGRIIS